MAQVATPPHPIATGPASISPNCLIRSTPAITSAAAVSASDIEFIREKEILSVLPACPASYPIASKTCDGWTAVEWHADPAVQAMPF